jgi:hypothetical protein
MPRWSALVMLVLTLSAPVAVWAGTAALSECGFCCPLPACPCHGR